MLYRKKQVEVEVIRYKDDTGATISAIQEFMDVEKLRVSCKSPSGPQILIETKEGTMAAKIGDYIIKGVAGEFYPCKPDIFMRTYEPIDEGICDTCVHDDKRGEDWPCINCINNARNHYEKDTKGWILCSEKKPEVEETVEVTYVHRMENGIESRHTTRAFYEDGFLCTEDSGYVWEDKNRFEYSESDDDFLVPEGWFEASHFAEELGAVTLPVIAWRPISSPYTGEETE